MDALLTINAGAHVTDTTAPEKGPRKHEEQFGKVLHKKRNEHPAEKKVAKQHSEPARQVEHKQNVAAQQTTGSKQQQLDPAESKISPVAEVEEAQQVVVVKEDRSPQVNVASTDVADDSNVAVQPADLVSDLEGIDQDDSKKEAADFAVDAAIIVPPEPPAKGVETPHAVEQAVVTAVEPQQQVVVATENQEEEKPLSPQAVAVAITTEKPQLQAVTATQNQKEVKPLPERGVMAAIATDKVQPQVVVATQNQEEENPLPNQAVVAEPVADEVVETVKDDGKTIDPRFAALLKPRAEKQVIQPLRDAASLHGSKIDVQPQSEAVTTSVVEAVEVKHNVEPGQREVFSVKSAFDQLAPSGHPLQGQGQVHAQGFDAVKAMPQAPMVQLSNGYQIPESQIFDQVVTQLSGSVNGESGRMVLRLQPAELGSLKIELKIEGDRVQAHLHAQTHQVQEVLERNLPQLRSALAEQGLKIDQFLVDVDQRQAEGQFDGQTQYQQPGAERQSDWDQYDHDPEEQMIPLAHLMQNGGGGISLHV